MPRSASDSTDRLRRAHEARWTASASLRKELLAARAPLSVTSLATRTGLVLRSDAATAALMTGLLHDLELAGFASETAAGWVALRGPREVPMKLALLDDVRAPLSKAWAPRRTGRGWSRSPVDPADALAAISSLRLRPEWQLLAYQHRDGAEAMGVVWAVPLEAGFPPPADLPRVDRGALAVPRPPEAHDDPLVALELDSTPLSFAHVWLVRRELEAFGTAGSAIDWSGHQLIDRWPWDMGWNLEPAPSPRERWIWREGQPDATSLGPRVQLTPTRAIVTVHTWCPLLKERITRIDATLKLDGAWVGEKRVVIGEGPGGVVI